MLIIMIWFISANVMMMIVSEVTTTQENRDDQIKLHLMISLFREEKEDTR